MLTKLLLNFHIFLNAAYIFADAVLSFSLNPTPTKSFLPNHELKCTLLMQLTRTKAGFLSVLSV